MFDSLTNSIFFSGLKYQKQHIIYVIHEMFLNLTNQEPILCNMAASILVRRCSTISLRVLELKTVYKLLKEHLMNL